MGSRIGLAVDSSCDLTPEFIQQHGIEILPIYIHHKDGAYHDIRDPKSMMNFYRNHSRSRYSQAQSEPLSVNEATRIIQDKLLPKYDRVNVITINSMKSEVFNRLTEAALINEPQFRKIAKSEDRSFRMRMVDSLTMFSGHAVLVHEFVRLIKEQKLSQSQAINEINKLRDHIYGYIIPHDLSYMRERRNMRKGDHNISWLSFKLASALNINPIIELHRGHSEAFKKSKGFEGALNDLFEHAKQRIKQGLATNTVVMSYAGLLEEIENHPSLVAFKSFAEKNGVSVNLSMMSTTAAVNVGPKSFSLAFAHKEEDIK
jgi:DegV family protein with EDD domain